MNGGEVIFHFKGDSSSLEKKASNVGDIIKGSLASKAIAKGLQTINDNLDDAIKRVDTLNNFPNVMKNLGIGTKESSEAIQMLSDKLTGLPTTLDDAASAVQRFTSKNGDVKKSSEMFLAVNNAIIAGGANMTIQSSALEQLSQAYSKGKMDMMEWRTLQTAMPAQLKQVASAMGYTTDELGEMMRQGDGTAETIEKFLQTIVKLNSEGTGEFASFEEQARASTGGIQTSITNMKTAVVRGVANMINSINTSLSENNLPTISEMIQSASKNITKTFSAISKAIETAIPYLVDFGNWVQKNKDWLLGIITVLGTFIGVFKTMKTISTIITGVKEAFTMLGTALTANPFMLIVSAISALVMGFIYLWNTSEGFRNFWIGLWNGIQFIFSTVWTAISNFFTITIPEIFNAFISFIQSIPEKISEFVQNIISFISNIPYYIGYAIGFIIGLIASLPGRIWEFLTMIWDKVAELKAKVWEFITTGIPEIISNIITFLTELPGKIWDILVKVVQNVGTWLSNMLAKAKEGIKKVKDAIVNGIKSLPEKMLNIGKNIIKGLWNGLKNAKDWLIKKIKDFAKGVIDGFKKAFGIHSPSKEFAIIGKFNMLGLEEGMKDMQPEIQKSIDGMFDLSPSLYGSTSNNLSPNVNVVVNANYETDPLGQVVNSIKTFSGGAKNDYNYGR